LNIQDVGATYFLHHAVVAHASARIPDV